MRLTHLLVLTAVVMTIGAYYVKNKQNRNIRNNNPLNIRESADWVGERVLNLDAEFEEFKTPEHGFRAAYIILLRYLEDGQNTIETIVSKWAPSNENHTTKYIDYIADKMELSPLDEISPTDLALLMVHMANYEGAKGVFTYSQARAGIQLAEQESFVIARLNRLSARYV